MIWYVINLQSFVILNLLRGSEDPPLQTGMAHHPGVAWSQIPSFRRSAHWSSLSKPLICFLKPPFFVGENTCTNTDTHWLAIRSPYFSVCLPIQVWLDPSLFRWFHGFTVSRVPSGISSDSLAASSNSWQRCVMSASADPVKTYGGFLWGIPSRHNN